VASDPLSATLKLVLEASEAIATFPLELPEDCGSKITLKDVLCPGARVKGVVNPEMLKPSPVTVTCAMVRLVPPVLLSVSDCVWLVALVTPPKLMLAGAALSAPGNGFCVVSEFGLLVLTPWHPNMVARASATASAFQRVARGRIGV